MLRSTRYPMIRTPKDPAPQPGGGKGDRLWISHEKGWVAEAPDPSDRRPACGSYETCPSTRRCKEFRLSPDSDGARNGGNLVLDKGGREEDFLLWGLTAEENMVSCRIFSTAGSAWEWVAVSNRIRGSRGVDGRGGGHRPHIEGRRGQGVGASPGQNLPERQSFDSLAGNAATLMDANFPAWSRAGEGGSLAPVLFLFLPSQTIADARLVEEVGGGLGVVAQLAADALHRRAQRPQVSRLLPSPNPLQQLLVGHYPARMVR